MASKQPVRVKLDLTRVDCAPFKHVWFPIIPSSFYQIVDVKNALCLKYNLDRKNVELYVEGALLPDDETVSLLRDNDIVRVLGGAKKADTELIDLESDSQSASKQNGSGMKHPAAPCADEPVKKKRKKKNRHDTADCSDSNVFLQENDSGVISCDATSVNSRSCSEIPDCEKLLDLLKIAEQEILLKCISKTKDDSVPMAISNMADLAISDETEYDEEDDQKNQDSVILDTSEMEVVATKPRRRRHRKRRKKNPKPGEEMAGYSWTIGNKVANSMDFRKSLTDSGNKQPFRSTFNPNGRTHILFTDETLNSGDSPLIDLPVDGQNPEENKDAVICSTPIKRSATIDVQEAANISSIDDRDNKSMNDSLIKTDNCKSLNTLPPVGAIIQFKMLELSELYCPEVSDIKVGKVINVNLLTSNVEIELATSQVEKQRSGKFDNIYPSEENELKSSQVSTTITVNWNDMIEPKMVV